MNVTDCLLVGLDARSREIVAAAARLAFPQASLTIVDKIADALQRGTMAGEILVLANPDEASLTMAAGATDECGLRRWAIVVLGAASSIPGVEIISSPEFDERLLARVFQSAVAQHQLVRVNQRAQGDLRTVAHRITHDLRTPLGGIISACEVVRESLVEHAPADALLMAPIFNSTEEISRLVDRVSYVLQATVKPVERTRVPMMEPVWAARQRLEREIAKKNALVIQPESWPEVSGVGRMLATIWWNLLTNALQHSGEAPQIRLGWSEEAGNYKFWVCDNGPGVSAVMRAKLFQPFNTLFETNASRGLGLSITQRLVELQGGRCGYQPLGGGGSEFFFTLPNT